MKAAEDYLKQPALARDDNTQDLMSMAMCIAANRYAKTLVASTSCDAGKLQLADKYRTDLAKIAEELDFVFGEESRNPRTAGSRLIRLRDLVNFVKLRVIADFDMFAAKLS